MYIACMQTKDRAANLTYGKAANTDHKRFISPFAVKDGIYFSKGMRKRRQNGFEIFQLRISLKRSAKFILNFLIR